MPTVLTHPVAALVLAACRRRARPGFALLLAGTLGTMLPDADTITRHVAGPWPAALLHRGLTHSLVFAAVVAAALAWGARRAWAPVAPRAAFAFLFACIASHGLLDMLTDGGPGVMLGWPFDDARVFFPWRPIAVSPLDADRFFAPRGVAVLLSELRWVWLPGLALAGIGAFVRRRADARAPRA